MARFSVSSRCAGVSGAAGASKDRYWLFRERQRDRRQGCVCGTSRAAASHQQLPNLSLKRTNQSLRDWCGRLALALGAAMTAKVANHTIPDDPDNDPDHPVPYLRVIDVAGYRAGGASLSIIVASPLDGSERSQNRLLDKIQGYLGHISSNEFIADSGAAPSPGNTIIEVLLHPDSSETIRGLLDKCHNWVQSNNASLVVRDLTDS